MQQKMTEQELCFMIDSLRGNINRMAVTNEISELKSMFNWAMFRIKSLYDYREEKIGQFVNDNAE
jgi:hypothetical protein